MSCEIIRYWAGRERLFRLTLGAVLDLEQALQIVADDKGTMAPQPIGMTFRRLAGGLFSVMDVHETLRIGLIGGGMGVLEARRLMSAHFDRIGLSDSAAIAADLLMALMDGVEVPSSGASSAEPSSIKFSDLSQLSRVFHMSPQDVRDLRYSDFINMMAGYNASSPDRPVEHLSEEEFMAILDKYEPQGDAS